MYSFDESVLTWLPYETNSELEDGAWYSIQTHGNEHHILSFSHTGMRIIAHYNLSLTKNNLNGQYNGTLAGMAVYPS